MALDGIRRRRGKPRHAARSASQSWGAEHLPPKRGLARYVDGGSVLFARNRLLASPSAMALLAGLIAGDKVSQWY